VGHTPALTFTLIHTVVGHTPAFTLTHTLIHTVVGHTPALTLTHTHSSGTHTCTHKTQ